MLNRILASLSLVFFPLFPSLCPAAPVAAAGNRMRLLCVEAVPAATRLVVMEKTRDGWRARWRVSVSSGFLTDPLPMPSRGIGLAVDPAPAPTDGGGFNGPPVAVTTALALQPFAECTLPGPAATVLLAPSPEPGKAPYRVLAIDTAAARFAAGSILWQNFTPHTVTGRFGGKAAQLAPGGSGVVVPGSDQAADMAQITLAREDNGSWIPFCDTRWPAKTDYRRFLLLVPRADGSIHPFVLPEYPPF